MRLTQKILNKFNGLHYPQEYLCLAKETLQSSLLAYIIVDAIVLKDITNLHSFVGYSPVVFVFASTKELEDRNTISIIFTSKVLLLEAGYSEKDVIAFLSLKKIRLQHTGEGNLLYYEGIQGRHHFVSKFHQFIGELNNKLFSRKPGNVFLEGNLYKQVQIAYSLPRKISLISVGSNALFNLFPTDLHGQVSEHYYVISLRHGGKACQQVEAANRIVLADVAAPAYEKVYSLGKNHMQPLREKTAFDFSDQTSKNFGLPLPNDVQAYKELELQESFNHGIHKLLLFKIIYSERVSQELQTLSHIHNVYATWRHNIGLPGNYLLR